MLNTSPFWNHCRVLRMGISWRLRWRLGKSNRWYLFHFNWHITGFRTQIRNPAVPSDAIITWLIVWEAYRKKLIDKRTVRLIAIIIVNVRRRELIGCRIFTFTSTRGPCEIIWFEESERRFFFAQTVWALTRRWANAGRTIGSNNAFRFRSAFAFEKRFRTIQT